MWKADIVKTSIVIKTIVNYEITEIFINLVSLNGLFCIIGRMYNISELLDMRNWY